MTTPSHSELKGQAGAYVLDALDPEDRASFEAHLSECDECGEEVRALRGVSGALARSVPQLTPRPELRERVLASFPGTSSGEPVQRDTRATSAFRIWLPLAAMLALTAGIGVYAIRLQGRVAELQSAMGVLAAPDLVSIDLSGQAPAPDASARALWSRTRGMVFTASNLPPLPAGRVYQVWVVTAQAPISAGLLTPDPGGAGQTFFSTPPDIPPPAAVAVSIEPAGGVPAPTGQLYLVGKPGAAS
jgi:anti-sigma-K factor RskA